MFANYFNMKIEAEQLRLERENLEGFLSSAPDSGISVEALQVITAVEGDAALTAALQELTDKHVADIDRLSEEKQKEIMEF